MSYRTPSNRVTKQVELNAAWLGCSKTRHILSRARRNRFSTATTQQNNIVTIPDDTVTDKQKIGFHACWLLKGVNPLRI